MYDVHTVADAILKIAKKNGKELTPMQLMKLVYIAHGWSLAIYGSGLFSNRIEAWRYGPVIPDLYQSTKQFGRNSIPFDLIDDSEALGVSEKDESLLRDVFEKYGQFTGPELSYMTHQAGTPWEQTYEPSFNSYTIPTDLIKQHYTGLLNTQNG